MYLFSLFLPLPILYIFVSRLYLFVTIASKKATDRVPPGLLLHGRPPPLPNFKL
jgi:hypothetical protein